ncbi:MAG: hypothetical protein AB7S26_33615 [Sandaracinaceae bacterium]
MTRGFLDGLCLAATIASDRDGSKVSRGLSPGLSRALDAALTEARERGTKTEVARWAASIAPVGTEPDLWPAALAILAPDVPRALGASWARAAPPVRRGFRVEPALRATLRRRAGAPDPDARSAEREAGRALLASDPDGDHNHRCVAIAASLATADVERAVGAVALGARGDGGGDAVSRGWRRAGVALRLAEEAGWPAS